MRARSFWAVLFGIIAIAHTAAAQTWAGSDPDRRPKLLKGDLDFALAELCFPYVIDGADIAALAKRPGLVKKGKKEALTFFVGGPDAMVVFHAMGADRSCTISILDGDPSERRAELQKRLDQWPTPLTPSTYQYAPNAYASREFLCAPAAGPHDAVLISTGAKGGRTPKLMATVTRSAERSARCEGEAPNSMPDSNPPPPATDPNSAELRAVDTFMKVCRPVMTRGADVSALMTERGATGPRTREGRPGWQGWVLPGSGLLVAHEPGLCEVYLTEGDPRVLRETFRVTAEAEQELRPGYALGMSAGGLDTIDLYCDRSADPIVAHAVVTGEKPVGFTRSFVLPKEASFRCDKVLAPN